MNIYNNIAALQTQKRLVSTADELQKTIAKLSSGLRINGAADDAAGLAVSEKMRAQIRGIDQAVRNSQDGISMIRTAEGALNECHSILQRMRELSVKAAAGTLTSGDRAFIQSEIDQLKDELDRVSSTTRFNKRTLLDGSSDALWSSDALETVVRVRGDAVIPEGNYNIEITVDPAGVAQVCTTNIFKIETTASEGIEAIDFNSAPNIEWRRSLGGSGADVAYSSIKQTSDDGFIVAGRSTSNDGDVSGNQGLSDYWIAKLDASGSLSWQKSLGGGNTDIAYDVQQTLDGGYIVAGHSMSNDGDVLSGNKGGYDRWITKLDASGTLLWEKSFGGSGDDLALSIQQTADGGFIVAGDSQSNDGDVLSGNKGGSDQWITKLDASGNLLWEKSFGGSGNESANSVRQTADGGCIVVGSSASNDGDVLSGNKGGFDQWITKLDASGSLLWEKTLGGSGDDQAYSVQQTSDGGFIVAGASDSTDGDVTGNHGARDCWIVKLDSSGTLLWEEALGGSGDDVARHIQQTSDGGFIVAGTSDSTDGDVTGNHGARDYWIAKLDASGSLLWEKSFGGSGDEVITGVRQTSDGNLIAAGYSLSNDGDVAGNHGVSDFWIVKLKHNTTLSTRRASTLVDIPQFYTSSGRFTVADPQTITIRQGDGKSAIVTLYGHDTLHDVADKINAAIAEGLDQRRFIEGSPNFCTVAEVIPGAATDAGRMATLLVRSAIPGVVGELEFIGDEDVVNAFGLNTIRASRESEFSIRVYDVHTGRRINNQRVAGNIFYDAVGDGMILEFSPMANTEARWNETMKNYEFLSAGGTFTTHVRVSENLTVLQTGANENEETRLSFGDMSARSLGVGDVFVSPPERAAEATTTIDAAASRVSKARSRLGAYQNRLARTINNLTAGSANLTASESRVRDLDMAKETMRFTRLNILVQAGMSMLAQANQLPENVLELLK